MSEALGPFVGLIGECVRHCDSLRGRLIDHLGVSPDDVTWSHIVDASRVLEHLRLAAHASGVCPEPEAYQD